MKSQSEFESKVILFGKLYCEFRKEISLIENGFKEEEKRALSDYRSNDKEFVKKLAFSAYNSNTYQVRMYGVFLFGYLSEQNDILTFMRDEVSKDDNWRVQEVLAKAFDEFCKNTGYEKHFRSLMNG